MSSNTERFIAARDQLLRLRGARSPPAGVPLATLRAIQLGARLLRCHRARQPQAGIARGGRPRAGESLTFAQLSRRSAQVADFLAAQGVGPGDRILLMLAKCRAAVGNDACGHQAGSGHHTRDDASGADGAARSLERGNAKAVVTTAQLMDRFVGLEGAAVRIAVGDADAGWVPYSDSYAAQRALRAIAPTRADDLLFLYFTSGTTARPKLVAHTQVSYPVGHLSTMYWLGLRPGDVHLNLSSPGWAKHAWSSFFAPWNAQAAC